MRPANGNRQERPRDREQGNRRFFDKYGNDNVERLRRTFGESFLDAAATARGHGNAEFARRHLGRSIGLGRRPLPST